MVKITKKFIEKHTILRFGENNFVIGYYLNKVCGEFNSEKCYVLKLNGKLMHVTNITLLKEI